MYRDLGLCLKNCILEMEKKKNKANDEKKKTDDEKNKNKTDDDCWYTSLSILNWASICVVFFFFFL